FANLTPSRDSEAKTSTALEPDLPPNTMQSAGGEFLSVNLQPPDGKTETSFQTLQAEKSLPPQFVTEFRGDRSGLGSANILLDPPILVAANVGGEASAIEPLLTPMPPPLNPATERLEPEFSPPALPVLAQQTGQRPAVESALSSPNSSTPNSSTPSSSTRLAATEVNETYTLGAGDRIFVEVFGLPQYSQEYQVLVDGSLNLPRAGRMIVEGMSLAETEALIYGRYSRYYRQPATSVVLTQPRSLQVAITGAVNRPGVYRLSPEGGSQFPSVTQAIQEAGGIGAKANLRNIELERSQRDGSLQTLEVNLWELLQSGNLSQDISLRDGDRLRIPEAQALPPEELSKISTANFSPETIEVSVVGSATETPGTLQVSPNTPLSQVVLAAGGFNDRKESRLVSLIRLHPNGTVEQRQIEVAVSGEVNENTNPILQHQDVVILDRSKGAIARERTMGFLGNLLRVIPFFSFF
ncbi:MAG: SLBB domain-containing protein, partial [Prochlorotrichaceae cyanobacterium]